jgi:hypothetical protein
VILVDYTCCVCGQVQEEWAASPPSSTSSCRACGSKANRQWSAIGLGGRAGDPNAPSARTPPARNLCSQYPQIPALCHMSESAGRMWVAKYTKDNRAIESELSRQQSRSKEKAPTMADAITHLHHPKPPNAMAAGGPQK